jgi:hypothetical protein
VHDGGSFFAEALIEFFGKKASKAFWTTNGIKSFF